MAVQKAPASPAAAAAIKTVLEAFAVGDALGMPTEFMTRPAIRARFGFVGGFIAPVQSQNHPNLASAQITDDTEQNVYLLSSYLKEDSIDPVRTAAVLLKWARETGAAEKKYIGPSSLAALKAIEAGADPLTTGSGGSTCGGIMRTPAAVIASVLRGWPLEESVLNCLMPTHNTSTALEAAMAYAFALRASLEGGSSKEAIDKALNGAALGKALAPYEQCAASTAARISFMRSRMDSFHNPDELLDFLYSVMGTGLPSEEVATAVFSIFMFAGKDVWLALRMGASIGGDTDTIAALSGALCAASAGRHNIPPDLLGRVLRTNRLDFAALLGSAPH